MLQATVQGNFPFKGKQRRSGDILTADDLDGVSRTVLDALAAQKLIVLSEEGGAGGLDGDAAQHLHARLDRQAAEIAELKASLPDAVEQAVAPLQAQVRKLLAALGEADESGVVAGAGGDAPASQPTRRKSKEA